MRVAFFGNVVNCLYQIAVALRESGDIEPHLYVSSDDPITGRPEAVDPELAGNYPAWIHEGNWITPSAVLAPWRAPITRELRQYDLVVVSGPGPIFAQFAEAAVVLVGQRWRPDGQAVPDHVPRLVPRGGAQGRGVGRGRVAATSGPARHAAVGAAVHADHRRTGTVEGAAGVRLDAVLPARGRHRRVRPGSGAVDRSRCRAAARAGCTVRRLPPVADGVPTDRGVAAGRSAQAQRHPVRGIRAVRARRRWARRAAGDSRHHPVSGDLPAAKELVRQLGIESQVLWATPPMPSGFPLHDLLDLYQASDVVVDDFGAGWFGYVALEGAAMGKPVVTHVDDRVMEQLYSDGTRSAGPGPRTTWPNGSPVWPPTRPSGDRIGSTGRDWVVRHHHRPPPASSTSKPSVPPSLSSGFVVVETSCRCSLTGIRAIVGWSVESSTRRRSRPRGRSVEEPALLLRVKRPWT